jgi:hypothetical protein
MTKNTDDWIYRWKNWVRATPIPGLYELKDGGYVYQRMVTSPATGGRIEAKRVMREASKAEAIQAMEQHVAEIRGGRREALVKQRFADFAVTLFEEKTKAGDFRSSATIERWKDVLIHLVGGTEGKSGLKVSGLGEVYVHMLEEPIRQWRVCMAELVAAGDYAPSTLNSWLSILRVITKAIKYDQRLERDPCERIKKFDESEHVTYSEEQPNALPPERAGEFLAHMFRLFPQHYAMAYLGFVTGLRPSSLRPLRRRGVDADVKWETSRLIVRQSQTIGDRVMKSTKQKKHYAIDLPKDVIDTLRWHVRRSYAVPSNMPPTYSSPATLAASERAPCSTSRSTRSPRKWALASGSPPRGCAGRSKTWPGSPRLKAS